MREPSWRYGVTRYQGLVLLVAWLAWVFDSMDATIYALVLHPALHDLLRGQTGGTVSPEAVGWYGGIIFSIFLIGWAIGGVVFGVLADRFGRTRTVTLDLDLTSNPYAQTYWQMGTSLDIHGQPNPSDPEPHTS